MIKKIALAHYWFVSWRGGEKVVKSLIDNFQINKIYTLFSDKNIEELYLKNNIVVSSFFNKYSFIRKNYQKLLLFFPLFVKSLRVDDNFDLIISSESGPIKGIRKSKNQFHICYVHTPMRYCYGFSTDYLRAVPFVLRPFLFFIFSWLRFYDQSTIDNVDLYIANSLNVKNRIKKYYNRDSIVIYPPISNSIFNRKLKQGNGNYYIYFGAIVPYKKVDLLIDAFAKIDRKLIIIGAGSERNKLEKRASKNVCFTGYLNDEELEDIISSAKCLLFPGEEDFGMIPIEVQAQGLPVIAYGKGGALETVVENRTNIAQSSGLFFKEQNVESLLSTIAFFENNEHLFVPNWIKNNASKFKEDNFIMKFRDILESIKK